MSGDGTEPDEAAPEQMAAYDKAKWHYDGNFPRWRRKRQAFVHTGFFLAWLADRSLVSDLIASESADRIAALRDRRGQPGDLYAEWDGVLVPEMLNEEANAFARAYYEQRFFDDYESVFPEGNNYKVRGSWQNYDRLAPLLDVRLADWRSAIQHQ